jgi:hypothetical protein
MSRAVNIDATEAHVIATCAKHGAKISTIEALYSGGTRVVLNNAVDAAAITKAYSSKVLNGPVQRMPTRLNRR